MKSCPRCGREYAAEINFCLDDGEMLMRTAPDEHLAETQLLDKTRPTGHFPNPPTYAPPAVFQSSPLVGHYTAPPSKSLALGAFATAMVGLTVGWCCFVGFILGPAAIAMGAVSLSRISKDPARYQGKNFAIAGIILGALTVLMCIILAAIVS